jgi:hypothetical protein
MGGVANSVHGTPDIAFVSIADKGEKKENCEGYKQYANNFP